MWQSPEKSRTRRTVGGQDSGPRDGLASGYTSISQFGTWKGCHPNPPSNPNRLTGSMFSLMDMANKIGSSRRGHWVQSGVTGASRGESLHRGAMFQNINLEGKNQVKARYAESSDEHPSSGATAMPGFSHATEDPAFTLAVLPLSSPRASPCQSAFFPLKSFGLSTLKLPDNLQIKPCTGPNPPPPTTPTPNSKRSSGMPLTSSGLEPTSSLPNTRPPSSA